MSKRALWPAPTGASVEGEDASRATDPVRTAAALLARSSADRLIVDKGSFELPGGRDLPGMPPAHLRGARTVALRLDPHGRLRIPSGVRVRLGISAPGRVLLGADASAGVLVVASLRVIEGVLDALGGGGER